MAKTKAELLKEAQTLGLDLDSKLKVADISDAIKQAKEADESKDPAKPEPKVAKSGKRSAKAIAEAQELKAKEERKSEKVSEPQQKPKKTIKPTRSKLERRSKAYQNSVKLLEKGKKYSLKEALELAVKTNTVKFDATVELHARLNVDPRQADQNLRDSVALPAGTGKVTRVAVFTEDSDIEKAKKAGADIVGNEEFLQRLDKGLIEFDVLISTPAGMPKLGKYARVLGPKGLMPNPKSGTVTSDVARAVKEVKSGKVEYRIDSSGIVHVGVGKVSFGLEKLTENTQAILASLKSNKPTGLKANYVQTIYITTTMGPSIPVLPSEL